MFKKLLIGGIILMSMSTLAEASIKKVIGVEKGYVNNVNDTGGATRYGVTEAVARMYGYKGDMRKLPYSLAVEIYYKKYWQPSRLDEFEDKKLAYMVFDMCINMGVNGSIKILQEAYNMCVEGTPLTVDGIIGSNTLKHINSFSRPERLRLLYECNKIARYIEITKAREKNEEFIVGWIMQRSELGNVEI